SVAHASEALTQRMIRECFSRMRVPGQLSAFHVEQVTRLARSQSGRRVHLPGGVLVDNRLGQIIFEQAKNKKIEKRSPEDTASEAVAFQCYVRLPTEGSVIVSVPEVHTSFRLKLIDWPCSERETRSQQGVLDAARLHPPLVLRSWQPGDAYRPCARHRPRKL